MTDYPFFLRLPDAVRRQIYYESGLISDSTVCLTSTQHRGLWSSRDQRLVTKMEDARWAKWCYYPNQLFYVSRAVSHDARSFFWSHNTFSAWKSYSDPGIDNVLDLTPLAWASLRDISISLMPCHWIWQEYRHGTSGTDWRRSFFECRRMTLTMESRSFWRQICERLATYQEKNEQLRLRLINGRATRTDVNEMLAPIHDLPRLKELSIRTGAKGNTDVQQAVMDTIKKKTRYFDEQPKEPFPFSKLPVELQICVLKQSGLIAPTPLINKGNKSRYFTLRNCCDRELAGFEIGLSLAPGEYCSARCAAFSNVHPCWPIPYALFRVSKTVRKLALSIFYSRNVFLLSSFDLIRQFPEHWVHSLRHLQIDCGDLTWDHFKPASRQTKEWTNALTTISGRVLPRTLTIQLKLPRFYPCRDPMDTPYAVHQTWTLYNAIVAPMACLRGYLKDFFVYDVCESGKYSEEARRRNELLLERIVMGEAYDSLSKGGKDAFVSWADRYYSDRSF